MTDIARYSGWRQRLRWRVALLADKLPRQCWANLVDWVLRNDTGYRTRLPWRPDDGTCRKDPAGCYCGKWRAK